MTAVAELLAYASACLIVQLLLSQPLLFQPLCSLTRLWKGLQALQRIVCLTKTRSNRRIGVCIDRRVPTGQASV